MGTFTFFLHVTDCMMSCHQYFPLFNVVSLHSEINNISFQDLDETKLDAHLAITTELVCQRAQLASG